MSDYEIAAMKVMSEQFSTAQAHGCWFHYNQYDSLLNNNNKFKQIRYRSVDAKSNIII